VGRPVRCGWLSLHATLEASSGDWPGCAAAYNMIVSSRQPMENPLVTEADAERKCPICGGPIMEMHGIARCMRCHTLIDTCCEGIGPNPEKAERSEPPPAGGTASRQHT
jgi:hypothetical protein